MKLLFTVSLILGYLNLYSQPEEIEYTWYKDKDSVYLKTALRLYDMGDYAGSLKTIRKFSRATSTAPGTFLLKGMNLHGLGRFQEAIEAYTAGLAINPNLVEFHEYRADANFELKNFSAARFDFSAYARHFPDDISTALDYALCLREENQLDRAIQHLEKFENKDTTVANSIALFYMEQENHLKAIETINPWLQKFPDYAEGYETLSIAYSELEYYDDALLAAEKLIALKPNYAYGYYLKGFFLEAIDEEEEAEKFFKIAKSLGFDPD